MAFPEQIDPNDPRDDVIATVGPSELRNIKLFLADVFGLPVAPVNITAPVMTIAASGVPTLAAGTTVASNPTQPLGIVTKQYADGLTSSFQQGWTTSGSQSSPIAPLTTVANQVLLFGYSMPTFAVGQGFVLHITFATPPQFLSLGLYDATGALRLSTSPVLVSSTGFQVFLVTQPRPVTIPAGVYWFGMLSVGQLAIAAGAPTGYPVFSSSNNANPTTGGGAMPATVKIPSFNTFGVGYTGDVWAPFALR